MEILSVNESESIVRIQSVNGLLFVEEDWMKQSKKDLMKKQKKK
ncbi:hypothetical protein [Marinifilum sp.]